MRFMVMVRSTKDSEAGGMPDEKLLAEMGEYNEKLVKAGVLLAGEGLHPSAKGARVRIAGERRIVVDGPFAETKELIAGFWLFQVRSLAEAIEWVKRAPNPFPGRESENRDPAGIRGSRFRRGAHPASARAGGTAAGAIRLSGHGATLMREVRWRR